MRVSGGSAVFLLAAQLAAAPASAQIYSESFEGGVVPPGWAVPAGSDDGWDITTATARTGTYSLKSGASIVQGQTAEIEVVINNPSFAELDFWQYWNAGTGLGNGDRLRVFVNDTLVYTDTSFVRGWFPAESVFLEPGPNTVRFSFLRVSFVGGPCNCTRIDDLIVTSLDDDNDGMLDTWEPDNGFDPSDPSDAALDGDTDGLTTLQEFLNDTDPYNPDSDDDGLTDGYEVLTSGTNPLNIDTDGDEIDDNFEDSNGLDPNDPSDAATDADGDGVSNKGEFRLGTDPQDPLSVPPLLLNYFEGFESGTVPTPFFIPLSADAGWSATAITSRSGSFSLQSGPTTTGESAEVVLPIFTNEAVHFAFIYFQVNALQGFYRAK